MTKKHLSRATTVMAVVSFGLAIGLTSDGFAAAAPAPAQQGAASPFGRLTPVAPTQPGLAPPVSTAPAPPPALRTGAAAPAAAGELAAPKIVVIDRNFIMQRSSAGKDMINQMQALTKAAETQFKKEENDLQSEANTLQQQMAIMAADVRAQKEKDFVAKQQGFQNKVQQRQLEIQAGFNKAARQLESSLEPILQSLMRERGANMVMDRTSVIIASVDIDITPLAVQRLDKSLPHVKVELTQPSAAEIAAAGGGAPAKP